MTWLTWPLRLIGFAGYFLWLLVKSNAEVITDVVTPAGRMAAGIAKVPVRCRTNLEITMLANLISLTPGTLTLAVHTGDEPALYVHGMYAPDPDEFRAEIHELEDRMLHAMRRDGDGGARRAPRSEAL
ncbi:Na+/H+ antiporter subunit E [Rhodococcus sp. HNM0569]|uniref:Na+/H+ antiporter subunit E n=1 Tax=Rhodococcus sp. HNM0569 TaxID=2716340 RepID=UPI00146C39BA|nr:Na+/H+ antiporter subunit E [Rhodococcus sp. HNM0569]NLU83518.1 Na+/H+ antiporter subunit E [Rhodococcus sp. HNM0569]